jgi:membrane-associated phospholipid phosphatase
LSYGAPALSPGNYYLKTPTEGGFVTFGAPDILDVVTHVANAALRAAWCQKWHLHMRLRPEVFGARIHQVMVGNANYPIHSDALNAQALKAVYSNTGSYLLPIAYPEGSPAHPSYPAGHAAIAGACVTVLKAFFNESFAIPAPVVASADGTALQPYDGTLTVGDELNKLAANIALARDTAGVHYRSDGIDGLNLGESVTVGMLHDIALTYHEDFSGFTFTRFDGSTRTICPNC